MCVTGLHDDTTNSDTCGSAIRCQIRAIYPKLTVVVIAQRHDRWTSVGGDSGIEFWLGCNASSGLGQLVAFYHSPCPASVVSDRPCVSFRAILPRLLERWLTKAPPQAAAP